MTDEVQAAAQEEAPAVPLSPYEYIKQKYPTAPNEAQVNLWKQQVPGGRVRFFELPDGKRALFLRAISPLELASVQAEVAKLENPQKQLFELQVLVAAKGTLWASFTATSKLLDSDLRTMTAGLPVSLHSVIWDLSDYIDPSVFDNLIIDL